MAIFCTKIAPRLGAPPPDPRLYYARVAPVCSAHYFLGKKFLPLGSTPPKQNRGCAPGP